MKMMRYLVVTALVVAGTWVFGWWTIPIIAAGAGAFGMRPWTVGLAGASAWGALLAADVASGATGRLTTLLAGVMGLPEAVIVAVTLLFPGLLAWSAAVIGAAARPWLATSRRPS